MAVWLSCKGEERYKKSLKLAALDDDDDRKGQNADNQIK